MTYQLFPTNLPGLTFDWTKTPTWSTRQLTSASGKEQRAANWSYPIYKFSLQFEFLRSNVNNEFQTLIGFCNQMQGMYQPFWFNDTTDNTATAQGIGIGDGVTKVFPLVRAVGGWVDPVAYTPSITAVYLNGVPQTPGGAWVASTVTPAFGGANAVTFVNAPAIGSVITADFTFYFACHFAQDDPEFSNMMTNLWEVKKLDFVSIK